MFCVNRCRLSQILLWQTMDHKAGHVSTMLLIFKIADPICWFTHVYLGERFTTEHCFCRAFYLPRSKVESPVGFDKNLESLSCWTKLHGYDMLGSYLLELVEQHRPKWFIASSALKVRHLYQKQYRHLCGGHQKIDIRFRIFPKRKRLSLTWSRPAQHGLLNCQKLSQSWAKLSHGNTNSGHMFKLETGPRFPSNINLFIPNLLWLLSRSRRVLGCAGGQRPHNLTFR